MDLAETPTQAFQRHPWEVVRAQFFRDQLQPVLVEIPAASVLDVGAGDGYFATMLRARFEGLAVTCFDPGYEEASAIPALGRATGIAFTAKEPAEVFDLMVLLDVLEHVEDDEKVLNDLVVNRVRPGGHVLISVPAWPRLFSRHDVFLKHYRRYVPRDGAALVRKAGLQVLRHGGLFHTLLPVRWVQVTREQRRGERGLPERAPSLEWHSGETSRKLLKSWLEADTGVSRLASRMGLSVPGLSWWALCRKP